MPVLLDVLPRRRVVLDGLMNDTIELVIGHPETRPTQLGAAPILPFFWNQMLFLTMSGNLLPQPWLQTIQ